MEGEQVFEQEQGLLQPALPCRLCRVLGYRDPIPTLSSPIRYCPSHRKMMYNLYLHVKVAVAQRFSPLPPLYVNTALGHSPRASFTSATTEQSANTATELEQRATELEQRANRVTELEQRN